MVDIVRPRQFHVGDVDAELVPIAAIFRQVAALSKSPVSALMFA